MSVRMPSISLKSLHRPRALATGVLSVFLLLSTGCALFGEKKPAPVLSRQRVFFAPANEVERALKQAMIKYPQKIDNPEAGIFETDWIKGDLRFRPAHTPTNYPEGYKYRILARIVKGKSTSKPAIKVIISKQIEMQRDFFTDPEAMPSDGLEETVLLYRISRELSIDKAIRRAQEKSNSNESVPSDEEDAGKENTGG
ncbi:MAG: hypothetical protein NDI61_00325 [Bdellovibrionaceae bacterium]|nr:hypothetical protein [Pseudobdellovibrionaceae bacterium]